MKNTMGAWGWGQCPSFPWTDGFGLGPEGCLDTCRWRKEVNGVPEMAMAEEGWWRSLLGEITEREVWALYGERC